MVQPLDSPSAGPAARLAGAAWRHRAPSRVIAPVLARAGRRPWTRSQRPADLDCRHGEWPTRHPTWSVNHFHRASRTSTKVDTAAAAGTNAGDNNRALAKTHDTAGRRTGHAQARRLRGFSVAAAAAAGYLSREEEPPDRQGALTLASCHTRASCLTDNLLTDGPKRACCRCGVPGGAEGI